MLFEEQLSTRMNFIIKEGLYKFLFSCDKQEMWFQKLEYRIERETESLPLQSLPSALTDHVTKASMS